MSEETKTDSDYVMMGNPGSVPAGGAKGAASLDDPNLSQEERDHRLAVALQQQENAAAFEDHKKKADALAAADKSRTARSNTFTRLAQVRDQDHGMLSVPAAYTTDNAYVKSDGEYMGPGGKSGFAPPARNAKPQEIADHKLASELQKFEQVGAGTVREMNKIVKEEAEADEAQGHRTGYSNYGLVKPKKK